MLEGQEIESYAAAGRALVFRYPRWRDLPQFIRMRKAFHREQIMAGHEKTNRDIGARRLADILIRMETGRSRWLFVFLDGKLVGQGQVDIKTDKVAVIGLALMKESRGLGLGRRMMKLLEREALQLNRKRLFLDVWSENTAAYELYKKLGYSEVGRRTEWERLPGKKNKYYDLVEMMKEIQEPRNDKTGHQL